MQAISVSQLGNYIKNIFDAEELLHNIPVVGEVFGVSLSRNVIYFSLKDENATLQCVCFYPALADLIEEGAKIIATGSPNYYVKGGRLNFNVIKVEKAGIGKLYEEFLKMKEKLEKEGLFDITHKKSMPENIRRIGVITSREGAVIQDIKNVAWRRNPSLDIVLFNTKVQGKDAEKEIARAIDLMSDYDGIDVIMVARGGGSLEDLSAYNTEIVARATYNCQKPIVSAVGHETDFTIIDFVSDLRAPTPSAGAELLSVNMEERKKSLQSLVQNFLRTSDNFVESKRVQVKELGKDSIASFDKRLVYQRNNTTKKADLFIQRYSDFINQNLYNIGIMETTLKKLDPRLILAQGYARIEQTEKPVLSAKSVDLEKNINIIFADGTVKAKPIKEE
mgnify:FL=1